MFHSIRKPSSLAVLLAAALLLTAAPGAGSAAAAGRASGGTGAPAGVQAYAATAVPAAPKAQANEPLRIVAVGDSLTAGYELGMNTASVPYGYAERVYEQALYHGRAELKNYGIIALRTPGLGKFLQAAADGKTITAEDVQQNLSTYPLAPETVAKTAALAADLKQAALVTVTIGGNDFTPIFDAIKQGGLTDAELGDQLNAMLDDYMPQLESSLRTILGLNPKATIVFADQYLPVPAPSVINKAITPSQYGVLTAAVDRLKGLDEALAAKLGKEGYDVRAVDVSKPFRGKELTYTYIAKGDIHPNQYGYDLMGRAFADGIWGSYREPAALPAGTPLRVVVNGADLKGGNKPVLKDNATFLPMRDVANALRATLNWEPKTRTATIGSNGKKVAFTIGANTMKVDGRTVPLETPAFLQTSGGTAYTYLPLAALSRGLGYQVEYRKPIATVFINS
ncbi:stalk domain-containing protein [Paenibacillus sp. GCM10023250]|uniref:stalk domain-containing protein n=1 Tax=Paenibacillus sp. GCM10023250 TaxID=3252648 RepID=UPI00360ACE07